MGSDILEQNAKVWRGKVRQSVLAIVNVNSALERVSAAEGVVQLDRLNNSKMRYHAIYATEALAQGLLAPAWDNEPQPGRSDMGELELELRRDHHFGV